MAGREFSVVRTKSNITGKIITFFVSDADSGPEIDTRPPAAEFPISILYDENLQKKRAWAFCDYMNKLEEAKQSAYDQIHLVDILSRTL